MIQPTKNAIRSTPPPNIAPQTTAIKYHVASAPSAYINVLFNRDRGQIRELNIGGIETNDRRQTSEQEGDGKDRTDPNPNGNTDKDDDDWVGG